MTEQEIALQRARREGFVSGLRYEGWSGDIHGKSIDDVARHRYPITVTKPRVVAYGTLAYRINGAWLEHQTEGYGGWGICCAARDMADLLANPTEEVAE
jgi:hypothetical protein